MFKVQNTKTKKFLKDAINGNPRLFQTRESAQISADRKTLDSHVDATAWNNIRPTKWIVVSA